MQTKTIKQTATFKATPEQIYELLLDSKTIGALTGGAAKISRKPKGKFEVFDGYCHGYNMELEPGKIIVQAWHFAEDGWPDNHYSICTFALAPAGKGTKLSFTQTDIPVHKAKALAGGWKEYYWEPIKAHLANK